MAEDAAGNIWVANATGLLLRAEGDQTRGRNVASPAFPAVHIRSLYATPDGGLCRMNPQPPPAWRARRIFRKNFLAGPSLRSVP